MVGNDDLFVKVPHGIQNYLMFADLNATQNKIFNAVVRYTYGFNSEWCRLSLSVLSVLTKSDKRQVTRELKKMLDDNVLLEKKVGRNRELRINPAVSISNDEIKDMLRSAFTSGELVTINGGEIDTSNSGESVTHIKKDKEINKEINNTSNYANSMAGYYISNTNSFVDEFLEEYYSYYERYKGKKHHKLKREQLERIYEELATLEEEREVTDIIIEAFFETVHDSDHNINHFATEGMIANLRNRWKG